MMIYKPQYKTLLATKLRPIREMQEIRISKKNLGEVCIETFEDISKSNELMILLRNKSNKIFGLERIFIEKNNPNASGLYIETSPEFRQKGIGIGEILRLSSIILILKNKIKEFEIFSKPGAVYFHSKYKFEPKIKWFDDRDKALRDIIRNCQNELESFGIQAEMILEKCSLDKNPESQRNFCIETNTLLKEYIQEVLKTKGKYKTHPFKHGFRLVLSSDKILNNKDFFNSLFKKHKINYQI